MYVKRGMGAVTSGIQTIAQTIQTVEGYYPGSLAYKNNNPGNLIFVGQAGATQGPPMTGTPYFYAAFPSYDDGYNALLNQIQIYGTQGLTINQMMNKYAPATDPNGNPTGNNPNSYANSIASALGVSPDTSVSAAISGDGSAVALTGSTPTLPDLSTLTDSTDSTDSAVSIDTSGTIDPTTLVIGAIFAGLVIFGISRG
jgi:hypothetical protein